MCRLVKCSKCDRPTFAGCGAHVEQVLGHVPVDQRCKCRETATKSSGGGGFVEGLKGLFRR